MKLAQVLAKDWWKLLLAIAIDLFDFTLGRIPGFGTVTDIIGGIVALALFGVPGAIPFLEIIDFTEQIDGFIPTVTLSGIVYLFQKTR